MFSEAFHNGLDAIKDIMSICVHDVTFNDCS